ncbi:MAG: Cys-Xaa-Xaa-Xaa repeat radical SAM target protein [Bacteroidaceae bacterium]|nr:Cys-Xaa-Xaa-Xaa repeat radical SAM target protein [Bacteroidaceae bacterium]
MKKNRKNEELQSRREFFKKAAKGALPILGAIAVAGIPFVAKAKGEVPSSCRWACSYSCSGGCQGSCQGSCSTSCMGSCRYSCNDACSGVCRFNCVAYSYGL